MQMKYVKVNLITLIILFFSISLCIYALSYRILIKDFLDLEANQNKKNLNTLIDSINNKVLGLSNLLNDYANWDESYKFIQDKNNNYIRDYLRNRRVFRILDVDFFIFLNSKNNVEYSKYFVKKPYDNEVFEKRIEEFIKKDAHKTHLFLYKDKIILIKKANIKKTNLTGKNVGQLIVGRLININTISNVSIMFNDTQLSNKEFKKNDLMFKLIDDRNIKVKIEKTKNHLINYIQIYNLENKHIFTIKVRNSRRLLEKEEETIFILNLITSTFLLLILILFYKNQRLIEKYNMDLEKKVLEKTNELTKTLRQLKERNKKLNKISKKDALTKINNRRSFFIKGKKALKKSNLTNEPLSLALIDVDHFKTINDSYGHAIGDEVLKSFCTIVKSILNKEDIFGRLGGEEFGIIFLNKDLKDAEQISEEIRKRVSSTILNINDLEIKFTISIGLTQKSNENYIDEMLLIVDEYLYEAKRNGRDRLVRNILR